MFLEWRKKRRRDERRKTEKKGDKRRGMERKEEDGSGEENREIEKKTRCLAIAERARCRVPSKAKMSLTDAIIIHQQLL